MIPKNAAEQHGFKVLDGSDGGHDALVSRLRELLPGVITEENRIDVGRLQSIVGAGRLTDNNQRHELRFAGKGIAEHNAATPPPRS